MPSSAHSSAGSTPSLPDIEAFSPFSSSSTASTPTTETSGSSTFSPSHRKRSSHHHHHHGPLHRLRHALHKVDVLLSLSPDRLQSFARDIYGVAIGLRGAHLVDCVHFAEQDLDSLAAVFNTLDLEPLIDLVILYEPITAQTFICNADVLGERFRAGLAETPRFLKSWFVRIDGEEPELIECATEKCRALVTELSLLLCQARHRKVGALPIARLGALKGYDYPERKLVTLAGIICGFPVVYVLFDPKDEASASKNALAHTPLYVCKVWLQGTKKHDDHLLLQCTFPATIFQYSEFSELEAGNAEVKSPSIGVKTVREVSHLAQNLFLERLDEARAKGWPCVWEECDVHIEGPITLDRVAL